MSDQNLENNSGVTPIHQVSPEDTQPVPSQEVGRPAPGDEATPSQDEVGQPAPGAEATPQPDPGNSSPENWTEDLSEEDQQEARDRAASEEQTRPKTLAELDAEYVAEGDSEDLTDRERHARVEAVRAAQHEQSRARDVDPNAPTATSSPVSRGEASVEFVEPGNTEEA